MRLTPLHALFMASKRLPVALALMLDRPSIDAVINAHAEPDRRRALPRSLLRPGSVYRRAALRVLASEPRQGGRPSRDAANARRWLRRMDDEKARAWWRGRAGLTGDALRAYDLASTPSWSAAPAVAMVPEGLFPGGFDFSAIEKRILHHEISRYKKPEISAVPGPLTGRATTKSPQTFGGPLRATIIQGRPPRR